MRLSITTDYVSDPVRIHKGLQRAPHTGFTHIHWCYHWNDDYIYSPSEIKTYAGWLREAGIGVTDLHGSCGKEKCWCSPDAWRREAGIEMVRNRMELTAALGADVIVMHPKHNTEPLTDAEMDALRKTIEVLSTDVKRLGVRIALENLLQFDQIAQLLSEYPPETLGLCYDSGHGHITGDGLTWLAKLKDRVISIHLHDNLAKRDLHMIPFRGTVDWDTLISLLGDSSYKKWISLEVSRRRSGLTADEFLPLAHEAAVKLHTMLVDARASVTA